MVQENGNYNLPSLLYRYILIIIYVDILMWILDDGNVQNECLMIDTIVH